MRGIDSSDIASRSGTLGIGSGAKAQAGLERFWVHSNSRMMVREAAAIALRRGTSCKYSAANAHAVFARPCPSKAEMVGIAADDIAFRRGSSENPSIAHDQAVLEIPWPLNCERRLRACEDIQCRRGRSSNYNFETDQKVLVRACASNSESVAMAAVEIA